MFDHRIYTFLTLYREMNYRKTAETLNMTQPGVTQHIQFLEAKYGVKLFRYEGKTLYRTPAAEILEQYVKRMMAEEKELRRKLRTDKEYLLRVGATKTIGEFVINPMAERFMRVPSNRLELIVDNTEALLAAIDTGNLDFALIEGRFDKSRYGFRLFRKERFVGICAASHRFAGQRIALEEIFGETLILREKGSGTREIMEQVLLEYGFSVSCFRRTMTVNNFSAIRQFVADNIGITFAYQSVAEDNRLAVFELEGIEVIREFNYVYCSEQIAEEKIKKFEA
ncbi:MAG: LysR family transcriptional regulator [Clostridiales bacterium]|nr:LysR family transcriptional regulator [Clostridiales bacterium]